MNRTVNPGSLSRLAAVAVVTAGLLLAGCSEMVSRTDFTARVKDKSDTEVAKVMGKPAAVDESAPDKVTWTYPSRTFNVDDRNKFDTKAVVVFRKTSADGKLVVQDVSFE